MLVIIARVSRVEGSPKSEVKVQNAKCILSLARHRTHAATLEPMLDRKRRNGYSRGMREAEGPAPFTARVVEVVLSIPKGKVATYGQVARLAGNPNGARQVVRVLWSQSEKARLPWHRIINAQGHIALTGEGLRMQRSLLKQEGVRVADDGAVDLKCFRWLA